MIVKSSRTLVGSSNADLGTVEGGCWVAPVAELRPGPPLLGGHGGVVAGGAVEGLVRLVPVLAQDTLVLPSYGLELR